MQKEIILRSIDVQNKIWEGPTPVCRKHGVEDASSRTNYCILPYIPKTYWFFPCFSDCRAFQGFKGVGEKCRKGWFWGGSMFVCCLIWFYVCCQCMFLVVDVFCGDVCEGIKSSKVLRVSGWLKCQTVRRFWLKLCSESQGLWSPAEKTNLPNVPRGWKCPRCLFNLRVRCMATASELSGWCWDDDGVIGFYKWGVSEERQLIRLK